MRKLTAVFLALLMLVSLCGCESETDKVAELSGQWETVGYYTSESIMELLVNLDLYEEEIALLDTAAVGYVDVITFNEDKTYTMESDVEQSVELVRAYFENAMDIFFEHRSDLDSIYAAGFATMSQDGFRQYYADMYGVEDYEALIQLFVDCTVDPAVLGENVETGTYRIAANRIYCTIDGTEDEEYMSYALEGDSLTLAFNDGELTYTRK